MARVVLEEMAIERSTYPITVVYTDESVPPQPITPDTSKWTLTDVFGNVINSKSDVDLSPDDSTDIIVLKDADLALIPDVSHVRRVAVAGTYTSATLGGSVPFVIEIEFEICPVAGVS